MAIFAVCERYSEDFRSWFSGYCLSFEIHVESSTTSGPTSKSRPPSTFCLLTGPLLPPLPLYSTQQPEQTFRNKNQIMFKTFYSLLISLRISFKLPPVAVRLHGVALSLTSSHPALLTHPVQLRCPPGCFSDTLILFLPQGFIFALSLPDFLHSSLLLLDLCFCPLAERPSLISPYKIVFFPASL